MGTQREKVIVEAVDKVSGPMRDAGSGFDKFSGLIKKAAIVGGIAIATKKIAELGGASIKMSIDAEEAGAAFDTTFGPAAASAAQFVEEFANKAGFANYELEQMLAITGNVVQGIGATEAESAALATSMATLAGDVASFSNASGGAEAVMGALQSAINGEREALKTYGLALSETEVQQQALNETGKTSASELTRLEKATATVTLAYEKAGKAVGDLDRTQDSSANSLRRSAASWKELQVEIGAALGPLIATFLPVITDLMDTLGPVLIDLAETAGPALAVAMEAIGEILEVLAPDVLELLGAVLDLAGGIITAALPALKAIAEVLGWIIGPIATATQAIANLFGASDARAADELAVAMETIVEGAGDITTAVSEAILLNAKLFAGDPAALIEALGGVQAELELTTQELYNLVEAELAAFLASQKNDFRPSWTAEAREQAEALEIALGDLQMELNGEAIAAWLAEDAAKDLAEAQRAAAREAMNARNASNAYWLSLTDIERQARDNIGTDALMAAGMRGNIDALIDAEIASIRAEDAYQDLRDGLSDLENQILDATEAQESLANVLLEAASPAFAAANAADRLASAQADLDAVMGDAEASAREVADAQLALAEATLEAQVRFDELDGAGLEAALDSIAMALGIPREAAADLLEELGVLDGGTTAHAIEIDVPEIPTIKVKVSIPTWTYSNGGAISSTGRIVMHKGGVVPGNAASGDVPALLQPGEVVIPRDGLSSAALAEALSITGRGDGLPNGRAEQPQAPGRTQEIPPILLEVPVYVDGREVARASAPHLTKEITDRIGRFRG